MAYYLLIVHRPGSRAYKEVANAKHHIEAHSLAEAQLDADIIVENHYPRIEQATMRLYDSTGLLATRKGEQDWVT
jgi:hypothetical protein